MEWQDFINMVSEPAQEACSESGLPWQVPVAQSAIESSWGEDVSGVNNYLGRKWGGEGTYTECNTQECIEGEVIDTVAKFQDYDDIAGCFKDWCVLVEEEPCYADALAVWNNTQSIEQFICAFAPIYATDPNYADKIWDTINACELI